MKTPFGDYETMYPLDVSGAVVLDIGADYGSTAAYFLRRGAKAVICSERDPEWEGRLREMAIGSPVVVVDAIAPENVAALFEKMAPDVVKVDCEGCEAHLLDLPDALLAAPMGWMMETHTIALYEAFVDRFEALGYEVRTVCDWPLVPGRIKVCKVIVAVRS